MGINSDWEKWSKTGTPPWEWKDGPGGTNRLKHNAEAKAIRKAMEAGGQYKARLANDNIMKATNRMGAMFAKPTGLGEQAAGYLKTAVPAIPRALRFVANPWLAAMAGMFAPSQMDQNRSAEYEGSPMHQQWLARRGPLAKNYGKTSVYVSR
tara:strand:+ start:1792 stop:2247 length:456 start_codon:yes stop_codon:yes gene_type:complete